MEDSQELSRCSSFEALTHDPNLSRLAKNMFQKTSDYLNYELSSNLQDYEVLDKMNNRTSKAVENMKKTTDDIVLADDDLTMNLLNTEPIFKKDLLEIEYTLKKLEGAVFRLDNFVNRLEEKINTYIQNKKS